MIFFIAAKLLNARGMHAVVRLRPDSWGKLPENRLRLAEADAILNKSPQFEGLESRAPLRHLPSWGGRDKSRKDPLQGMVTKLCAGHRAERNTDLPVRFFIKLKTSFSSR
jgi:hypothetical protein